MRDWFYKIVTVLIVLCASLPAAAQVPGVNNVPASLVAETTTPAAGSTITMAIRFTPYPVQRAPPRPDLHRRSARTARGRRSLRFPAESPTGNLIVSSYDVVGGKPPLPVLPGNRLALVVQKDSGGPVFCTGGAARRSVDDSFTASDFRPSEIRSARP